MQIVWKKKKRKKSIRTNKTSTQYLKLYDSLQFAYYLLIPLEILFCMIFQNKKLHLGKKKDRERPASVQEIYYNSFFLSSPCVVHRDGKKLLIQARDQ